MRSRRLPLDETTELDRLTLLLIARECELDWRRFLASAQREDPNRITDRGIHLRAQAHAMKRVAQRCRRRADLLPSAETDNPTGRRRVFNFPAGRVE